MHETIKQPHVGPILWNCHVEDHFDSARNQQGAQKYLLDAELLQKQPMTARNIFYIAESYRSAREYQKALEWYVKRYYDPMDGCDQERWWAALMIACCQDRLSCPEGEVIRSFVIACDTRPSRAESFVELAKYLWKKGYKEESRATFDKAMRIPMTTDTLNVNTEQYAEGLRAALRALR